MTSLYLLPLLFGGIGFIQPCTMGINAIFFGYMSKLEERARVVKALKLTIVRSFFFAALGLLITFLGRGIVFQDIGKLGIPYLILGSAFVVSRFRTLPIPNLNLLNILGKEKDRRVPIELAIGLTIPSCVIPLTMSLLITAAFFRSLLFGFTCLFLFGLALSFPLIIISYSSDGRTWLQKITKIVKISPFIAGMTLILTGLYFILFFPLVM